MGLRDETEPKTHSLQGELKRPSEVSFSTQVLSVSDEIRQEVQKALDRGERKRPEFAANHFYTTEVVVISSELLPLLGLNEENNALPICIYIIGNAQPKVGASIKVISLGNTRHSDQESKKYTTVAVEFEDLLPDILPSAGQIYRADSPLSTYSIHTIIGDLTWGKTPDGNQLVPLLILERLLGGIYGKSFATLTLKDDWKQNLSTDQQVEQKPKKLTADDLVAVLERKFAKFPEHTEEPNLPVKTKVGHLGETSVRIHTEETAWGREIVFTLWPTKKAVNNFITWCTEERVNIDELKVPSDDGDQLEIRFGVHRGNLRIWAAEIMFEPETRDLHRRRVRQVNQKVSAALVDQIEPGNPPRNIHTIEQIKMERQAVPDTGDKPQTINGEAEVTGNANNTKRTKSAPYRYRYPDQKDPHKSSHHRKQERNKQSRAKGANKKKH